MFCTSCGSPVAQAQVNQTHQYQYQQYAEAKAKSAVSTVMGIIGFFVFGFLSLYFLGIFDNCSQPPRPTQQVIEERRGGRIGDYYLSVLGVRHIENDMIAITYEFTNLSDSTTSFMLSVKGTVFQDGIELDSPFLSPQGVDNSLSLSDIMPRKTIIVERAYYLTSTSDLVIILDRWVSVNERDRLQFTIPYRDIE